MNMIGKINNPDRKDWIAWKANVKDTTAHIRGGKGENVANSEKDVTQLYDTIVF